MAGSTIDLAFISWRNNVNARVPHPKDVERLACLAKTIARYARKSSKYDFSWFYEKIISSYQAKYNDMISEEEAEEFFSQLQLMLVAANTPPYPNRSTRKYILKMDH